jgi:hypothetical protein
MSVLTGTMGVATELRVVPPIDQGTKRHRTNKVQRTPLIVLPLNYYPMFALGRESNRSGVEPDIFRV